MNEITSIHKYERDEKSRNCQNVLKYCRGKRVWKSHTFKTSLSAFTRGRPYIYSGTINLLKNLRDSCTAKFFSVAKIGRVSPKKYFR